MVSSDILFPLQLCFNVGYIRTYIHAEKQPCDIEIHVLSLEQGFKSLVVVECLVYSCFIASAAGRSTGCGFCPIAKEENCIIKQQSILVIVINEVIVM